MSLCVWVWYNVLVLFCFWVFLCIFYWYFCVFFVFLCIFKYFHECFWVFLDYSFCFGKTANFDAIWGILISSILHFSIQTQWNKPFWLFLAVEMNRQELMEAMSIIELPRFALKIPVNTRFYSSNALLINNFVLLFHQLGSDRFSPTWSQNPHHFGMQSQRNLMHTTFGFSATIIPKNPVIKQFSSNVIVYNSVSLNDFIVFQWITVCWQKCTKIKPTGWSYECKQNN